ncbi:hypothetical protein [Phycicoccus sp. Soil803]|uniref:hypothetical protein n=1 Tax=Phycicoccus sp. Soil803 TaxID=1736415 RepID=UPI000B1486D3|nr:hypothetical protein [Phycicoccus sp. Soil803]
MASDTKVWTHERGTRAVTVRRPLSVVTALLADPTRYSEWAIDYFTSPVVMIDESTYRVSTVPGERRFRVDTDLDRGTFDLYLAPIDGPYSYPLPIRVLANGEGADVVFTVTREPELSDDDWRSSLLSLENELNALKRLLES